MMTDIDIAQSVSPQHIKDIASRIGIAEDVLELYGKYKAKIPLSEIDPKNVDKSNLI